VFACGNACQLAYAADASHRPSKPLHNQFDSDCWADGAVGFRTISHSEDRSAAAHHDQSKTLTCPRTRHLSSTIVLVSRVAWPNAIVGFLTVDKARSLGEARSAAQSQMVPMSQLKVRRNLRRDVPASHSTSSTTSTACSIMSCRWHRSGHSDPRQSIHEAIQRHPRVPNAHRDDLEPQLHQRTTS